MTENNILFMEADEAIKTRLLNEWGKKAARHMHLTDGFSIVALHGQILVGLISTYWRELPAPLNGEFDGYIDILEVHRDFKRKGIATQLIEISMKRTKEKACVKFAPGALKTKWKLFSCGNNWASVFALRHPIRKVRR